MTGPERMLCRRSYQCSCLQQNPVLSGVFHPENISLIKAVSCRIRCSFVHEYGVAFINTLKASSMSEPEGKISIFRVVLSVLAAMSGVQSSKNRERDFARGRPAAYIIVGIIMTVVFILILWTVVSLVTGAAGV